MRKTKRSISWFYWPKFASTLLNEIIHPNWSNFVICVWSTRPWQRAQATKQSNEHKFRFCARICQFSNENYLLLFCAVVPSTMTISSFAHQKDISNGTKSIYVLSKCLSPSVSLSRSEIANILLGRVHFPFRANKKSKEKTKTQQNERMPTMNRKNERNQKHQPPDENKLKTHFVRVFMSIKHKSDASSRCWSCVSLCFWSEAKKNPTQTTNKSSKKNDKCNSCLPCANRRRSQSSTQLDSWRMEKSTEKCA